MRLGKEFFKREDVVQISRDLLGKTIYTKFGNTVTAGIITETEAYAGLNDKASHAYGGRRTSRTETLYQEGGISYVYLCYGIHHLFNFVTNVEGIPHAVLLRGIYPIAGMEFMVKRTSKVFKDSRFSDGPGKLTKALGIKVTHNGLDLEGDTIWVEGGGWSVKEQQIYSGPRIGVDYAGTDALLPYRFLIKPGEWAKKNLP